MSNKEKWTSYILSFLEGSGEVQRLEEGKDFVSSSLHSLALQVAKAYRDKPFKLALGFPTLYDLQSFSDALSDFLESEDVALYPEDEILRLGKTSSSKEMARERLRTLFRIRRGDDAILLFNAAASLSSISAPDVFFQEVFELKKGQIVDRDELIRKLTKRGYARTDWVKGAFEFAVRGSIVDFFSPAYDLPVRVELCDETIASIRLFSPMTALSERGIDEATVLPAGERLVSEADALAGREAMTRALSTLPESMKRLDRDEKKREVESVAQSVLETGILPEQERSLFPFFPLKKGTILDYLKGFLIYAVSPSSFLKHQESFKGEEEAYYRESAEKGLSLFGEGIYEAPSKVDRRTSFHAIEIDALQSRDGIEEILSSNASMNESGVLIDEAKRARVRLFACLDEKSVSTYESYLRQTSYSYGEDPSEEREVTILPFSLTKGFRIGKNEFLSSLEIFGAALKRSRFLTRYKDFKPVKKYSDLKVGDYVVEEKNGIGIFQGTQTYKGLDYLSILYAGKATLLVPIQNFPAIRRYAGSEAAKPALDAIGGATWARRKAKIKSRMAFLADRLLDIYAEREKSPGIAFRSDPAEEEAFAQNFPYPLTESQVKAWAEIQEDMESPHPMDRLVAGDVGFGKTELAFKAIFKAAMNGYQSALLCPTTVLSRQHFEVAKERFKGFGVRIGLLNRFNGSKEEKKTLQDLSEGNLDLVVGTHRLLSTDVRFKDLGLLVVDEEQKFGVAQKERIKEIARSVDVLSLSATPIPRTLQMSLLSIRPMSTLEEAPQNRLPVKTYVCPENDGLIKEVIERELARNGQVYFLHNRIETIYSVAGKLKKMFPEVSIGVAHGRMESGQIADVMNDFYDGAVKILVSTSIIESGLDVPNVNTILVENAQNFGLAQLYQIKGRVGRSSRLAYAYLFYPDYDRLSDEGRKRLKAIREFTELGSGYRIAEQDLAIRGSGNILGSEQAGFVDSLGYETYTKLLKEVIEQKRASEKGMSLSVKKPTRFTLSFSLDAHIPDGYASASDRINLYRELQDATREEEVIALMKKVKDSFGPYPKEVENLFRKRIVEIDLDEGELFSSFEELMEEFRLTTSTSFSDVKDVKEKMEKDLSPIASSLKDIRFAGRRFSLSLRRTPDSLSELFFLVRSLLSIQDGKSRSLDLPLE